MCTCTQHGNVEADIRPAARAPAERGLQHGCGGPVKTAADVFIAGATMGVGCFQESGSGRYRLKCLRTKYLSVWDLLQNSGEVRSRETPQVAGASLLSATGPLSPGLLGESQDSNLSPAPVLSCPPFAVKAATDKPAVHSAEPRRVAVHDSYLAQPHWFRRPQPLGPALLHHNNPSQETPDTGDPLPPSVQAASA